MLRRIGPQGSRDVINRLVAEMVQNQVLLSEWPETSVRRACERMRKRHVGSVLVTNGMGRLLGIFTERDAARGVLAAGRDAEHTVLAEVMTPRPSTLRADATTLDALRLMQDGGFQHVPVLGEDGIVGGMVSFADFRGLDFVRMEVRREE